VSRLLPYAQLVRLPNVFTALADICLGALATGLLAERWRTFALLLPASACLYCAGMVWNDFFDLEQDRRERPERPLPSGRVTRRQAAALGAGLMAAGVVWAALAGSVLLALALAAAILLYDGWLKRTPAGPVAMGACRFLNVLLAVSVSGSPQWPLGPHLALVVGLYIVGVTWFARTEARASSQAALKGAAGVMLAAFALAVALPTHLEPGTGSPLFPYLLVALGFWVALPVSRAIASPKPGHVQAAVKRCLMGLVLLDAVLAAGVAGTVGLVILVLLAPSLYLNRKSWLYAT